MLIKRDLLYMLRLPIVPNVRPGLRQPLHHTLAVTVVYALLWEAKQTSFAGFASPFQPVHQKNAEQPLSTSKHFQSFNSWSLWKGVRGPAKQRRLTRLQRPAVVEVGPTELEASIRGGGAVILDIYAVWCMDLQNQNFVLFPSPPGEKNKSCWFD